MTEGTFKSLGDRMRDLESQEKRPTEISTSNQSLPDIKGFLSEMKKLGVKTSTSVVVSFQLGSKGGDHGSRE